MGDRLLSRFGGGISPVRKFGDVASNVAEQRYLPSDVKPLDPRD